MSASKENSPVKTYRHEMPDQPPVHPQLPDRRNVTRIIIALLTLTLLILLGANFLNSPATSHLLSGKANVSGRVVDEHGLPVSARVIIFGTELATTTDQNGVFSMNGVPPGSQMLVVDYNISAVEIPLTVIPGQDMNVGQVQFKVTAAP
jgi:hypothetical protein